MYHIDHEGIRVHETSFQKRKGSFGDAKKLGNFPPNVVIVWCEIAQTTYMHEVNVMVYIGCGRWLNHCV